MMHQTLEVQLAAYEAAGEALVARIRQQIITERRDWRWLPEACRGAKRQLPDFRYCSAFGLWFVGRTRSGYAGLYVDCDDSEIVIASGQPRYVGWQASDRFGLDIVPARTDQILEHARTLDRFNAKAALREIGQHELPEAAWRRQRARGLTSRDLRFS